MSFPRIAPPKLPQNFLAELARRRQPSVHEQPPAVPPPTPPVDDSDLVEFVEFVGDQAPLEQVLAVAPVLLGGQGIDAHEREAERFVRQGCEKLSAALSERLAAQGGDTSDWVECLVHLAEAQLDVRGLPGATERNASFFRAGIQAFQPVLDVIRRELTLLAHPTDPVPLGEVLPRLLPTPIGHLTLKEALFVLAGALERNDEESSAQFADRLAQELPRRGVECFPNIAVLCDVATDAYQHLAHAMYVFGLTEPQKPDAG